MLNNVENLLMMNFKISILDNLNFLRNLFSKKTVIINYILKKCEHQIILLRNSFEQTPKDLYPIIGIIKPHIFPSQTQYLFRYCEPKLQLKGRAIDYNGQSHMQELNFLKESCIFEKYIL